jgi:hypothetical protein
VNLRYGPERTPQLLDLPAVLIDFGNCQINSLQRNIYSESRVSFGRKIAGPQDIHIIHMLALIASNYKTCY